MAEHVAWPNLFPLAARLRLAREVVQAGRPIELLQHDPDGAEVLRAFYKLTEARTPAKQDSPSSDVSADPAPPLQKLLVEVSADVLQNHGFRAQQSQDASVVLAALQSACPENICDKCSRKRASGGPCRWLRTSEVSDNELVQVGDCLGALRDVYAFVDFVARRAYQAAGVAPRAPAELSTGHVAVTNDALGINFFASTTDVPPVARSVRVNFFAQGFGLNDYLSLPYVMLHEALVHGYCGVPVTDGASECSKTFHEGWMDCIAHLVLHEALATPDPQFPFTDHGPEFLRQEERVRLMRFNADRPGAPAEIGSWLAGERALRTFRWLLRKAWDAEDDSPPSDEQLNRVLIDFSLALNASQEPHVVRGQLVDLLNRHFGFTSAPQLGRALVGRPQVLGPISAFLQDRNVRRMISGLKAVV